MNNVDMWGSTVVLILSLFQAMVFVKQMEPFYQLLENVFMLGVSSLCLVESHNSSDGWSAAIN